MNRSGPVTPKPSSTVVVVRPAEGKPEILLVRRRAGDAFGESYTFPGGVVDPDETAAHAVCSGLSADDANRILGVPNGLDFFSAAIRELFEETGILLARTIDGSWPEDPSKFADQRIAVDRCELPWAEFLREEDLCMAVDTLHYFAWWITPVVAPKRWTTRFFVAALPPGQDAEHDGREVTDSRWMTADDALRHYRAGDLELPQPTWRNLTLLKDFDSVEPLLEWAAGQHEAGIDHICPVQIFVDGEELYPIPGDPEYPESAA